VARNRKRAKERRARRPTNAPATRPGVATTRTELADERPGLEDGRAKLEQSRDELEELPGALEHAAPDVELAQAQLALGRPDLAREGGVDEDEAESEDELADEDVGGYDGGEGSAPPDGAEGSGGGEVAPVSPAGAPAEHRRGAIARLINFLQGSWRELQRVQWPDRRQVMQATGVVIGFVIVAGVYLAIADDLAGKLMTLILK
jgi:preprotein translocase SecE subunit